jgi:hypothetical protein
LSSEVTQYVKPYADWLDQQARAIQPFQDYYDGNHRLAFATLKFRQTFGAMFRSLSVNWCESAVDVAVDRLKVEGFRFGRDQEADKEAWDTIWQPNNLDAASLMAHTEAGKSGRAYAMVDPVGRITVEHPQQMVVAHAAGNRSERLWAFKRWLDEDEYLYAILYLPDRIEKFRSTDKRKTEDTGAVDWEPWPNDEGEPHLFGVVPVVPFYNKPDILCDGRSDLIAAMPIQDAIDKEIADMLVASEFAAFPQRVLMGVEVPTGDDGLPLAATELKASISRLWAFENENAKIGEFKAADLNNYVQAITSLLQQFAAITRTPPHYLLGQVVNASGDALKAAEAGLASKVERKQVDFSDSWEEVIRLAFRAQGNSERAEAMNAETIWASAEKRSEAELVDAAVKLKSIGLPAEMCLEYVGFTPRQIERFNKLKEEEPEPPAPPPSPAPAMPPGPMAVP